MYTKEMIDNWFEKLGSNYIYVIGYDGYQHLSYTDARIVPIKSLPTEASANHYMDQYMPEVEGSFRRLIWVDAFDRVGKLDLDELFKNGNLTYAYLNEDF